MRGGRGGGGGGGRGVRFSSMMQHHSITVASTMQRSTGSLPPKNSWSLYITIWPILMQNFQTLFVFELKYSPGETHSMLKADCPKLFFDGLVQFFSFNKIINIFVRVKMNRIAPQNVFFRGNSCQHQQQEEQLLQTSSATPANH